MSNAKWQRLFAALEPLKRVLAFRRKDIDEEDHKVSWNTDLYEMFGLAEMIEWLEVRAKVSVQEEHSLRWIVDDHTTTLIDALREIHVPYERTEEGVKFWGYVRPGFNPKWVDRVA